MSLLEKIINLLNESGVWYELLQHPPVFTSTQAALVRQDASLHQGAKAMVLRVLSSEFGVQSLEEIASHNSQPSTLPRRQAGHNSFVMVVCPGDLKIDFKKVRQFLKAVDATLASPQEVEDLIGVKIGAVSPLGNLSGLPVLVEASLLDNEIIAFNAGDHQKSVKLRCQDYLRLSSAVVGDFARRPESLNSPW